MMLAEVRKAPVLKYSITVMRPDRTDLRPTTFGVSGLLLWGTVFFLVVFPFVSYWVTYAYIAPQMLGLEVAELRQTTAEAQVEAESYAGQYDVMTEENSQLRTDLQAEKELRAALESKITIAETARGDLAQKTADLEEEVMNLRRSVRFYEQFMKPNNEKALVQCFNIRADLDEEKNQLKYRVSVIKTDRKDKKSLPLKWEFRILAGASAKQIDMAARDEEALHTRTHSLKYDATLSSSFKAGELPEGVRLLDIKGFDENHKPIAHCWKAF